MNETPETVAYRHYCCTLQKMKENSQRGWQAKLELDFALSAQRTILIRRSHVGPLQVQRPFYPEADGTCHVYILHPPGGIVGGDELSAAAHAGAGTRVLLTSPAATKFYRSGGKTARQVQRLKIADNACLEWLPQETIVYSGAAADISTRVLLKNNAVFMGWEILCLGRPAAGELFAAGACRQAFEVWRDGRPLVIEKSRFSGAGENLSAAWGLQGFPVTATFICAAAELADRQAALVDSLRSAVRCAAPDRFSVTRTDSAVLCRYLGPSAQRARLLLTACWTLARQTLLAKPACLPRIWNT